MSIRALFCRAGTELENDNQFYYLRKAAHLMVAQGARGKARRRPQKICVRTNKSQTIKP